MSSRLPKGIPAATLDVSSTRSLSVAPKLSAEVEDFLSAVEDMPTEAAVALQQAARKIEAFDLSHIFTAAQLAKDGKLVGAPYVQFVMGVKNAMPVDRPTFNYYRETTARLMPDAEWCAAGIGAGQLIVNEWCVAEGGHARAGLEDNVRLDKDRLAPSNAALVQRVVELCNQYERPVATVTQARDILGLAKAG